MHEPEKAGARRHDSTLRIPVRHVVRWVKRLTGALLLLGAICGALDPEFFKLRQIGFRRLTAEQAGDETVTTTGEYYEEVDVCSDDYDSHAATSAHSSTATSSKPDDVESRPVERIMTFLAACFLIGCVLDFFNRCLPEMWRLPFSAALYLAGLLVGLIAFEVNPNRTEFKILLWGTRDASQVDAHAIFYIFLPPLLYESAASMSWHVFRKVMSSAALLALPGVLLNIVLTGSVMTVIDSRFHWEDALMLASILSATDPVAVVAALQFLGAPLKLSSLIEGESLLNDGSAVVFFYVFRDMVAKNAPAESKRCLTPSAGCIGFLFVRLALGGILLGLVFGKFTSMWLGLARQHHHPTLEVGIVFVTVYMTFAAAEAIEVSGVLAVVTLGVYVAARVWNQLSHHGRHVHHVVFQTIGYLCNQGLFFISGIVSYRFMFRDSCSNWWWQLGVLYVVVHITRSLVVVVFWPFLRRWGYGISWKEAAVVVYGGLRGAVGLAMGLLVEHDEYVDSYLKKAIAFHTSGIVLLTLLINGSTVDEFYDRLRLYPPNPFRMNHVRKMLTHLEDECKQVYKAASKDWFLHGCQWEEVLRCVPDYRNIDFGLAGAPQFGKVTTVHATLQTLNTSANNFCTTKLREAGSCDEKFEARWQRRKQEFRRQSRRPPTPRRILSDNTNQQPAEIPKAVSNKSLMGGNGGASPNSTLRKWLIRAPTTSMAAGTDQMYERDQLVRLSNKGDRRLVYGQEGDHHEHEHGAPAIYVSSKPLSLFHCQEFMVKLAEVETTKASQIIAGVFLDKGRSVRQLDPNWQELSGAGLMRNSVGYDCMHGRLRWNTTGEASVGEQNDLPVLREGMSICVRVTEDDDNNIALFFMTENNQVMSVIQLPDFAAEDLYPVIEFRNPAWDSRQREKLMRQSNSRRGSAEESSPGGSPTSKGKGRRKSMIASLASSLLPTSRIATDNVMDAVDSDVVDERVMGGSKSLVTPRDGAAGVTPGSASEDAERPSFRVRGGPTMDAPESPLHRAIHLVEDEVRHVNEKVKNLAASKVLLSFEPRTATDAEGLNMMFQFIFNALSRQYHLMHEHRNLSAGTFTRLTDSVAHADDCANNENGAATASHLLSESITEELEKDVKEQGLRGQELHLALLQERLQNLPPLSESTTWQEYEALFVEYLLLQRYCQSPSWWDDSRWHSLRWLGYGRTKVKIEMLWAFIETHERIVGELSKSAVQRFPELRRLMHSLIDQAKADLEILQDINPRHYFFVKHFIALRMMFTMKLGKLEKCVNQGWVAASDVEGLREELEERLHQVENFYPHIHSVPSFSDLAQEFVPKGGSQSMNPSDEGSWDITGGVSSVQSNRWQLHSTFGMASAQGGSKEWGRRWHGLKHSTVRGKRQPSPRAGKAVVFSVEEEEEPSHSMQNGYYGKVPELQVCDIDTDLKVRPMALPETPSPAPSWALEEIPKPEKDQAAARSYPSASPSAPQQRASTPNAWMDGHDSENARKASRLGEPLEPFELQTADSRNSEHMQQLQRTAASIAKGHAPDGGSEANLPGVVTFELTEEKVGNAESSPQTVKLVVGSNKEQVVGSIPGANEDSSPWSVAKQPELPDGAVPTRKASVPMVSASQESLHGDGEVE